MNLIARYVSAVKRYLPAATRDDVGAELQGLLQEQLDAKSDELGRAVTEEEIAALLKRHGHPYKTAAAYSPTMALVGAGTFALYKRTMSRLLSVWFLVIMLLGLYDVFVRDTAWAIYSVPGFWHMVVDVLLALFFIVTIFFHVWGHILEISGLGWRWDPAKLPPTQSVWIKVSKSRLVVWTVVLMSFLGAITSSEHAYQSSGVSFAVAESVVAFVPAIQSIVLLMLVINGINLFQSYWTRVKLYASAFSSFALAILLGISLLLQRVILLSEHGADATELGNSFLAIWPETVLKAVAAISVILLLRAGWRSWRLARTEGLPAI